METTTYLFLFLLFLIPFKYLLTLFLKPKPQLPLPPGPHPRPIIGHLHLAKNITHHTLTNLSLRYSKGSGLLYLRLGLLHTLTITTPAMAKQILHTHDSIFSNRPSSISIDYLTYNRSDMVFSHYGPFWRQMRKLFVTKLFSRRHCGGSWAAVRREVYATVVAIARRSGRSVNVGEMVNKLTKNVTFSAAFGSRCRENEEELVSIMQEFSELFGAFDVGDFFPWLRWFDLNGLSKRLRKVRVELDCFIDKIVDEHRRNRKGRDDEGRDMVDEMLDFLKDSSGENGVSNSECSEELKRLRLSRDNIKGIIMDIIFGGIETVASAIEWTMAELMKNPPERKKAQAELADVVGLHRRVSDTDLDKLTHLKCIIKESLRLHPPVPLLLHEAAIDIAIAGRCFVPARTRVMINVYAIGRDESAWNEPDSFRPSRFAAGDGEAAGVDFRGGFFELIPFGAGRRSCPGMQLGMYVAELAVAELLHCFDWELPDGMKPSELSMEDVFGLTAPRAVRLVAVPTPRLSCPLEAL